MVCLCVWKTFLYGSKFFCILGYQHNMFSSVFSLLAFLAVSFRVVITVPGMLQRWLTSKACKIIPPYWCVRWVARWFRQAYQGKRNGAEDSMTCKVPDAEISGCRIQSSRVYSPLDQVVCYMKCNHTESSYHYQHNLEIHYSIITA